MRETKPPTKRERSHGATHEALMQAAYHVALHAGAEALTLDAVAKEAGVSKGGLLYHFPNKEALLVAMVEKLIVQFEQRLAEELRREEQPMVDGGWLRAYIRASDTFERECASLQSSMLVAIAKDRNLLAPLMNKLRGWKEKSYGCGVDPVVVEVILLALDGITLNGMFGFDALEAGMNAQAIAYLLNLTRTAA